MFRNKVCLMIFGLFFINNLFAQQSITQLLNCNHTNVTDLYPSYNEIVNRWTVEENSYNDTVNHHFISSFKRNVGAKRLMLSDIANLRPIVFVKVMPELSRFFSIQNLGNATIEQIVALKHTLFNAPMFCTVGASGAVFGILLAFGWLFPQQKIFLYFLFPIPARIFVIIYAIVELFFGVANFSGDNIAHFAHLGGMLFGLILLWWWRKKGIQ